MDVGAVGQEQVEVGPLDAIHERGEALDLGSLLPRHLYIIIQDPASAQPFSRTRLQ